VVVFLPPRCSACGAIPGKEHLSWCPESGEGILHESPFPLEPEHREAISDDAASSRVPTITIDAAYQRRDHAAARVINGVRLGPECAETWEVVDPASSALAEYDAFVWHDSTTGLNHRTESLNEAIAFNGEQAKILEQIDAAEAAAVSAVLPPPSC
jgi:hypothetical protein